VPHCEKDRPTGSRAWKARFFGSAAELTPVFPAVDCASAGDPTVAKRMDARMRVLFTTDTPVVDGRINHRDAIEFREKEQLPAVMVFSAYRER